MGGPRLGWIWREDAPLKGFDVRDAPAEDFFDFATRLRLRAASCHHFSAVPFGFLFLGAFLEASSATTSPPLTSERYLFIAFSRRSLALTCGASSGSDSSATFFASLMAISTLS